MIVRPATLGAVVIIVVVGFAIGAWLAIRTRGPDARVLVPAATPTVLATTVSIATAEPTAQPAATVSVVSTTAPSAAPAAAVAYPALQGAWRLDEANVQVGTIVWVGSAVPASRNSILFSVYKQTVGGRPAVPCERQTALHATFSLDVAQQTVPYREVNCNGILSIGEVRVTSFSRDGTSFSGSFSRNGVNLGNFTARKL